MRKTLIYKKRVQDETGREYILWYSLVIRVAEHGRIYGVEIDKTNEYGRQERALIDRYLRRKKRKHSIFWKDSGAELPCRQS